jgi:biopolymer transport protein ExbD
MHIRHEEEETIELPIVPMIDCAFLLLVFFLIATTMKKPDNQEARSTVFKVTVPKGEAPQSISTEDSKRVFVTADGTVAPGDAAKPEDAYADLGRLVADLKTYREGCERRGKESVVVIEGDKDVKYQRIIQVWNAAKSAGIRQVSFAVDPGQAN